MSTKRILSLVLALVMVLGTFSTMVFAETANEKVEWLKDQGIVQGDEKGELNLDKTIDRASVAKLVVEALDLGSVAEGMKNYKTSFSDVPVTHWANGYINVVSARGIMIGDAGKFMPGNQISYAEVLTILVRIMDGLTADEEKAAVWPTTYIAKAHELGILEDVNVASYQEAAVRQSIFEMFYNAMTSMEVGNYTVVKGIVLENYRVEKLDKDTVLVEVLEEIKRADYVEESRKLEGAQLYLTIDAKVGDVENLLGRVADFTVDKNNKVVAIKLDTTYKVETGAFTATKNKIAKVGSSFTVNLPERYSKNDETIFRTYYNNSSFAYEDFYSQDKADRTEFSVEYAKVTVKNGRVLYIDAFNFEDIAPVQEVRNDGAQVFVYNDARDGGIKRYDLSASAKVLTFNDGAIGMGTREDIDVNDVIHEFNGGFIVRKDARVDGTYEKVSYSRESSASSDERVYVNVDGERYQVLPTANKKPVYSYENEQFFTLETRGIDSTLRDFKDEDVTLLIDINDDLQLMTSEMELREFAALISNVIGKEVRVLKGSDNAVAEYTATLDSSLKLNLGSGHRNLNEFRSGDVVYLSVDENNIETMLRLVAHNAAGLLVPNRTVGTTTTKDMTSTYIKTDNNKTYRILDRTNVFVRTGTQLKSTTISDVLNNYKLGANDVVRAEVLSDKDYNDILNAQRVNFRRVNSNLDDVAHTIVFTDISRKGATYNYETVRVLEKDASGRNYELKVEFSDKSTAYRVLKGADAISEYANVQRGDFVELAVTKDDDKFVYDIEILLATNANVYEVAHVSSGTGYRALTLKDAAGTPRTYWVFGEEFGYPQVGDKVSIYDEDDVNNHLDLIVVRDSRAALSYWGGGSAGIVTDGIVTNMRYSGSTGIQYVEITKGTVVKEYEVRGLARDFVEYFIRHNDEVKVIVDGNYLVGFEYIKLSGGPNTRLMGYVDSSSATQRVPLTVPAAWAGFVLDGAGKTIDNNFFTVDADNATIKDVTFTGNITVSNKVANDFTANNVTVQGTTTIAGGSSNTVNLIDSTFGVVAVTKANVRIKLEDTAITTLNVGAAGVKVEKDADSTIGTVNGNPEISTELEVTVASATYAANKVDVAFKVEKVALDGAKADVTDVETKGTVSVVIKDGAKTIQTSKLALDSRGAENGEYVQALELLNADANAIKGKTLTVTVTVKYDGKDFKGEANLPLID